MPSADAGDPPVSAALPARKGAWRTMDKRFITIIVLSIFLAAIFISAVTKVQDTDAWMHLTLGRTIWQQHGFPATEPLAFSAAGLPFSYTSWLFGVLCYLSFAGLGIPGVVLLTAFAATALFAVLLADSLRPVRGIAVALPVLAVTMLLVRFRFIERPDLFALLFLAVSVFCLNAYRDRGKRYLYALPVVHLLWANMHTSIALMPLPFLAHLGGALLRGRFPRPGAAPAVAPAPRQFAVVGAVLAASFGASLINPNGLAQYTIAADYLASPFFKQVILEFQPLTWSLTAWPFFFAAALILSFAANRRGFAYEDLLLALPFLVLPFVAARFIVYFGVIAGPIIARNLSCRAAAMPWWRELPEQPRSLAAAVIIVLLCAGLAATNRAAVAGIRLTPGIGIDTSDVPEQALAFMDRTGITGRVFNLFDWGGYILWRDHPRRSVFVDPRGAIPRELLEYLAPERHRPAELAGIADRYGIDAILVGYSPALRDLSDGGATPWALVYWDDSARLYIRRNGPYGPVARDHEYRVVRPEQAQRYSLLDPAGQEAVNRELDRAARETGSSRAYTLLGSFYNETGRDQEALAAYTAALAAPLADRPVVLAGIGYSLERLGSRDEALRYYERSLDLRPEATVEYLAGKLSLSRGDRTAALRYFERAIVRDPSLTPLYPLLAGLYQELGRTGEAKDITERYQRRAAAPAGNEQFQAGLQAYGRKDYPAAIEAFGRALQANPHNAAAASNLGYAYYDMGNLNQARYFQQKAVEINPGYANAYYGLALALKKQGEPALARKAWQEYLRIEPRGYYARKALEEVRAIDSAR